MKIKFLGIIGVSLILGTLLVSACASMTLVSLEQDTIEGPKQVRQGDDIDPKAITVWGIYKDESRKTISVVASNIVFDKNAVGTQTVKIRRSGKEASFQTEVMALVSVKISSPPSTLIYKQGQNVSSWAGLAVQGEWDQMGSQNIPLSSTQITGYNKDQAGTQSISVSYMGKTANFNVSVVPMTAIRITQNPTKVDYAQGEALNLAGMKVVGVWQGLPEETLGVAASDVTGYNANTAGIQRLTITKSGITATFSVEVLGLTSIVIDKPPNKTDYAVGEQINLAGIVVNGNYTGSVAKKITQAIPVAQLSASGFNSGAVAKNQRVTVTVGGQTANFFVNITDAPAASTATAPAATAPAASAPTATGISSWMATTNHPFPTTQSYDSPISCVAYANNKWIAGGYGGKIASSTDGITWTEITPPISGTGGSTIAGIAYANNRWIVVVSDEISTSTDNGVTWTRISGHPFRGVNSAAFQGIAYGNNRWVAVASQGKIAYSDNGTTWTAVANSTFPTDNTSDSLINSVAYGNNRWVAVGNKGRMATSTDNGVTWTSVANPFPDVTIKKVAYNNNRWVAVTSTVSSGAHIATSTNGTTWTLVATFVFPPIARFNGIAYGNGRWVAFGRGIATSTDGVIWKAVGESPSNTDFYDIAWGNNKFVAGGYGGRIVYSATGQ